MAEYKGMQGVWAVGSYNDLFEVNCVSQDPIFAIHVADSHESIFFWPYEMTLQEAINLWATRDQREEHAQALRTEDVDASNAAPSSKESSR